MTIYTTIASPIGELLAAREPDGPITEIHFEGRTPKRDWHREDDAFDDLRAEMDAWFAGRIRDFTIPLAPSGTEFQRSVWSALRTIPYGATASYRDIAERIGRPSACRAVGAANGANPIPIIIPCHRVIGSNGSLTGFGGGLDVKRQLLAFESGALRLFSGHPSSRKETDPRTTRIDSSS